MKLIYRRCGDYYLPNIGIPAEDMRPLGKYGRMRMRYLREHRSLLFNQLLLSGKLMKHLYSIDDACQERVPSSIMRKFIYKSGRTQSAQGRETCP